jgi:DNA-directed RNA polymerase subunit M
MMFCPKCGSLLKTKQQKTKTVQFCSCGYSSDMKSEDASLKETIKSDNEEIQVVQDTQVHPLIDADCPKCSHDKAYYWLRQTRAGDEPETKFYKCEKCKHTWRDYS